jgi:hypothetical protein
VTRLYIALALFIAGCAAARADDARSPVVLELFTSQGCSSCPPADALLTELAASRPGVIALAFHVDYWDSLGWKDEFSSPEWSARQASYGAALRSQPYTPQLVIEGRTHVVGSSRIRALAAIEAAARLPSEPVTLSARRDGEVVRVAYDAGPDRDDRVVWVALTESGRVTKVARGENAGETLKNDFVVRAFEEMPGMRGTATLRLAPGWRVADLRVVAIVQARAGRDIRGAAVSPAIAP